MDMVEQAMHVAGDKLQMAIKNQRNFKTIELCFDYYREATFWDLIDDGYDEILSLYAEFEFIGIFNNHFGTNFGE